MGQLTSWPGLTDLEGVTTPPPAKNSSKATFSCQKGGCFRKNQLCSKGYRFELFSLKSFNSRFGLLHQADWPAWSETVQEVSDNGLRWTQGSNNCENIALWIEDSLWENCWRNTRNLYYVWSALARCSRNSIPYWAQRQIFCFRFQHTGVAPSVQGRTRM